MSESKRKSQKSFWVLTALIGLLYLIHFASHAQKNPLRLDEVDYYQCMENVVRLGYPLYYAGEVNIDPNRLMYLSTRYLDEQEFVFWRFKPETGILKETFFALVNDTSRYTFGMWHPPLYIYLGSLVFRLLPLIPENSYLLRYFNLVFGIGIFAAIFILSQELYPARYRKVFLVTSLLYALHSLAVRGSTLIDYNATLGPCVTLWFVIALLHAERKTLISWELVLATVWALFTGLGIAASLFLGLGIYSLLRYVINPRRNPAYIITFLLSASLGIILFLISFFIFCQILQLPFSQPFLHNIARVQISSGSLRSLQRFLSTLWTHLWWYSKEIGLFNMIVWAGLSIGSVLKGLRTAPQSFMVLAIIATGLISQASLGANAYWFPKHILFVLPLELIFIAGEGITLISCKSLTRKVAWVALFLLLVLTNVSNSLHWLLQPGSTLYSPGERGLLQIAHALQAATSPEEIVLSRKDIGFFARRRFIEWSGRLLSDVTLLQTRVNERNIRYAVSPISLIHLPTDIGAFLQERFSIESEEGDFVLLRYRER